MPWLIAAPKVDANVSRVKVVNWLVREGDAVSVATPLVEVETEKAVFVIESECAGVLRRIDVASGVRVPVGACLGVVAAPEEVLPPTVVDAYTAPVDAPAPGFGEYDVDDYDDALFGG